MHEDHQLNNNDGSQRIMTTTMTMINGEEDSKPCATTVSPTGKNDSILGTETKEEEQVITCGICLEDSPQCQYGLLSCCNHAFCYDCLMQWRKNGTSGMSDRRSCPTCRKPSDYVIPSIIFPKNERVKERIVQEYKNRKASIPCRRFQKTKTFGSCPFGSDCLYAHIDENGQDVKSLDKSMEAIRADRERRQRRRHHHLHGFVDDEEAERIFMRWLDFQNDPSLLTLMEWREEELDADIVHNFFQLVLDDNNIWSPPTRMNRVGNQQQRRNNNNPTTTNNSRNNNEEDESSRTSSYARHTRDIFSDDLASFIRAVGEMSQSDEDDDDDEDEDDDEEEEDEDEEDDEGDDEVDEDEDAVENDVDGDDDEDEDDDSEDEGSYEGSQGDYFELYHHAFPEFPPDYHYDEDFHHDHYREDDDDDDDDHYDDDEDEDDDDYDDDDDTSAVEIW